MKNLRNQTQLVGRLGVNPEISELSSGSKKAFMNIATSETYKNKSGEKVTDTQWHYAVAYNATANYANSYLNKGTEVMVLGKLVNRSYEDKTGTTRCATEIVSDQVLIISKKEQKESSSN